MKIYETKYNILITSTSCHAPAEFNLVEWRKLHNKELNDLYSLPNFVRVVNSRRMRWAGHVACMGVERGVHRALVGKPDGKRPLGDTDVDGRIILRWILRKLEYAVETGHSRLRIGTGGGHL
jgi:hypothetical protein